MNNLSVRWGATLPLVVTNDEEGASTATLTVSLDDEWVLEKTVAFDGVEADLTLTAEETQIPPNTYNYMLTIDYEDGTVEKYPDTNGCKDCDLPVFEVCDTNDNSESS